MIAISTNPNDVLVAAQGALNQIGEAAMRLAAWEQPDLVGLRAEVGETRAGVDELRAQVDDLCLMVAATAAALERLESQVAEMRLSWRERLRRWWRSRRAHE